MNSRTLPVLIGDKTYQLTSDDQYLDYVASGFEPEMVRLFRSLINGDHHVFDIGANIGCTAILFGDLCKEVQAFEPSKSTFSFLETNVRASGMNNIHIHNIALGESNFESELTLAASNRSGAFVSNQTKAASGYVVEKIEVQSLDYFTSGKNISSIDFIKIDVEGFEGQVIRGGPATISRHDPVVALELNHWCLNAFQRTSIPDFFDFLRGIFPLLYAVDEKSGLKADLRNADHNYHVMYEHIIHFKWMNIVGAFRPSQLERLSRDYRSI